MVLDFIIVNLENQKATETKASRGCGVTLCTVPHCEGDGARGLLRYRVDFHKSFLPPAG